MRTAARSATPQTDPDAVGNDLKIDSSNLVVGRVGAEADHEHLPDGVRRDERDPADARAQPAARAGARRRPTGRARAATARLTVRDSGVQGEDLNLIWPSDASRRPRTTAQILVVENTPRAVPHGIVDAPNGWVNLRAGDNMTLGNDAAPIATSSGHACGTTCPDAWLDPLTRSDPLGNTQVLAAKWIDIYGDFHGPARTRTTASARSCTCTGRSRPARSARGTGCAAEINPGRDCNVDADLRQHRRRHDHVRPDVPRRAHDRLRLERAELHRAHDRRLRQRRRAEGGRLPRTSSSSTACRRRSTRRSAETIGGDVRAAHTPDARRPGRHRHLRRSTRPAARRASAPTRSPARSATTT